METKKTTVEKYSKELDEIENNLELFKAGEICDFEMMNKIKILLINVYTDGKCEGIQQMRDILKN